MGKPNPAKGMSTASPEAIEHDYEAENAHDTLTRAHKIMNDEKLMPRVRKIAGAKSKAASDINDMLAEKKADPKPTINSTKDLKSLRSAMATKRRESA